MEFNSTTGNVSNHRNYITRVVDWGNTSSIENLDPDLLSPLGSQADVFRPIVDQLVGQLGYVRGVSLRGAPYDWRLTPLTPTIVGDEGPPRDVLDLLQKLVEETSAAQGRKVLFLTHSLGGKYVLELLRRRVGQAWKDRYLAGWITVSTPFAGSTASLLTALAGKNEHIFTVDPQDIKLAQRTWESLWWMFPDMSIFGNQTVVATSPGKTYTLSDLRDLFSKQNFQEGYDFFTKRVAPLQDPYTPVGTPTYCFFSHQYPTLVGVNYSNDELHGAPTEVNNNDGDGSANSASLEVCRRLKPAAVHNYTNIEHLAMIQTKAVIDDILKTIRGIAANQEMSMAAESLRVPAPSLLI